MDERTYNRLTDALDEAIRVAPRSVVGKALRAIRTGLDTGELADVPEEQLVVLVQALDRSGR